MSKGFYQAPKFMDKISKEVQHITPIYHTEIFQMAENSDISDLKYYIMLIINMRK